MYGWATEARVVFVCFYTRALHIELAGHLISDNDTQFVGVNSELRRLIEQFKNQANKGIINNDLVIGQIKWHFIPHRSPHFGGLWEAAVKSVNVRLAGVVRNTSLNYELLYSLLVQMEGVLNSRHTAPMSNDPTDPSFLAPSNFLTGNVAIPIQEPSEIQFAIPFEICATVVVSFLEIVAQGMLQ